MARITIQDPSHDNVRYFPNVADNYYNFQPQDLAGAPGAAVILIDDVPVALAGMHKVWDGFGQCWAFFSPEAKGHAFQLRTQCKWLVNQGMAALELRSLFTLVRADNRMYNRWAKAVGFSPESPIHGVAPDGGDMIIYMYRRVQ